MNQPVYVAPNRKGIPYGMMNFAAIRRDNYYYVDKTHFIPQIEQANRFFFFIRPRRFGKSLTLSVLQHYKEFAHDASVIQTLVSQGFITGELKKGFPATNITSPDNFISLLYYFGMLTISGSHQGKTKLTIPNIVVQEQLYAYLLSTYDEVDLSFSSYVSVSADL